MDEQKLKEKYYGTHHVQPEIEKRIIKVLMVSVAVLGVIYLSKYFLNATADTIRAFKNVKNALKRDEAVRILKGEQIGAKRF